MSCLRADPHHRSELHSSLPTSNRSPVMSLAPSNRTTRSRCGRDSERSVQACLLYSIAFSFIQEREIVVFEHLCTNILLFISLYCCRFPREWFPSLPTLPFWTHPSRSWLSLPLISQVLLLLNCFRALTLIPPVFCFCAMQRMVTTCTDGEVCSIRVSCSLTLSNQDSH